MAVISKGHTFATGDQVTAVKLNNLADAATFASGAVDNVSTQLSGGAISVKDGGITPAKLSTGGLSWEQNGKVTINGRSDTNESTLALKSGLGNSSSIIQFSDPSHGDIGQILYDHGGNYMRFKTNDAERMRIDSAGRLLVGLTSSPTVIANSIACSGRLITQDTYNQTSSASANVVINSSGFLFRSTSSGRYKENIQDYDKGIEAIKSLRPVTYQSINEDDDNTYAGFIAEEVHNAGLTEFVEYNPEGQPDALHYANMNALLTKALQEALTKIETLEARVEALENA